MLGILLIWDSSKEVENILEEFKEILKNSYQKYEAYIIKTNQNLY